MDGGALAQRAEPSSLLFEEKKEGKSKRRACAKGETIFFPLFLRWGRRGSGDEPKDFVSARSRTSDAEPKERGGGERRRCRASGQPGGSEEARPQGAGAEPRDRLGEPTLRLAEPTLS